MEETENFLPGDTVSHIKIAINNALFMCMPANTTLQQLENEALDILQIVMKEIEHRRQPYN